MLSIKERQNAGITILDLDGNIIMGGGSSKFGQELRRLMADDNAKILLNFSRVKYIDSSGVGELLSSANFSDGENANLVITNLSAKVEEVLALSGVLALFDVQTDEAEGINSLTKTE